jgi:transaldolase
MKIFADTANIDELKEFKSWGVIDGCTTNPLICVKNGVTDFESHMKSILTIMEKKPVSIEVTTNDPKEMLEQTRTFATWGENVVVKLPMNIAGLKTTKIAADESIKVNVTACMDMNQAVLAAKAGATYVSLFWGRIEDMGYDAAKVSEDTRNVFDKHNMKSEIILGSLRSVGDVTRASKTGAHILTIPSDVLKKLQYNPRTESTINEFLTEWSAHLRKQESTTKEKSRSS